MKHDIPLQMKPMVILEEQPKFNTDYMKEELIDMPEMIPDEDLRLVDTERL
jgi:hypothetical protein